MRAPTSIWKGPNYTADNIAIDMFFSHKLNEVTLAQEASLGDRVITVESGHNIVAGGLFRALGRSSFYAN